MTKKGCSCRILCSSRTGFWVFRVRFHKCNIKLSLFVLKCFNVLMHSCIRAKQLPREVKILSILSLSRHKAETTRILRLTVVFQNTLSTHNHLSEWMQIRAYIICFSHIRNKDNGVLIVLHYPELILTKLNSKCFSLHIRSCISIGWHELWITWVISSLSNCV